MELFKGEFFNHPCALEYSGNECSNGCAYCFASVRKTGRVADLSTLGRYCLGKSNSNGLEAFFFNNGYPICVSNKSDPFATSNCVGRLDNTRQALALLDLVPNGVFFQTKGMSKGADFDILDGFKKKNVVVYITISSWNEEISKRIEPGAPLPKARVELAKYCKARGWYVMIGVNPCYGAWLPDEDWKQLLAATRDHADAYYFQELLLKTKDLNAMEQGRRERMPADEIKDALAGDPLVGFNRAVLPRPCNVLETGSGEVYFGKAPYPCFALEDAHRALGKGLNQVQDFMNFCIRETVAGKRDKFTFEDFLRVMFAGNEEMINVRNKAISSYIVGNSMMAFKAHSYARNATAFADLYRTVWNDKRMYPSPQTFPGFVADGEDDMGNVVVRMTDKWLKIAGRILGERR